MSLARDNLINDIRSRRQSITTTTQPQASNSSIWDIINSESVTTRKMKVDELVNKLKDRHNIRLKMAAWDISSWNKNTDKLENARSSLADYARSQYIEEAKKDKSMDLSRLDKMKDQDIIDWMTKDDPEAKQTYIDFINKWWFVKDAYNKIMWIDEEAIKEEEAKNSWWWKNFVWSAIKEIPNQIWWLMDITWVTNYLNNKDKKELDKYNQVSTDEYNKYKNWQISFDELKKKWVSWIYLDYEEDVKNWRFRWSIEDYWRAMYDKWVWRTNKTTQEKMQDDFLINYDPEWDGAWAGKFAAQMAEFAMLPWANGWFWKNVLAWTAEILWLNALSEWKLPTAWEWLTTASITALVEWMLRTPWAIKVLRSFIGNTSPEIKNALSKTTRQQWKEYGDIVKKWFTATKNKATEYLDKAATWIKDKLKESWESLQNLRKNMKWDFKFKDYFDSINNQFKKFETEWGWGKNAAPEIIIRPNWKMEIYNEEALSNIVDDKWQKLVDLIKSEWEAFRNQWRADSIQNVEAFMRNLNDKIYEASTKGWIKSSDSTVKAFLEWTKDAYDKIYAAMWKEWQAFKEARERFSKLKDYEEFFEKYIWKIKSWEKGKTALADLEKTRWGEQSMWKGSDFLWEFLKLLKEDNIVKEDLQSELTSLLYSFWIKNPKQIQEMLETIYPSMPWLQEVGLNILRRNLKNSEAETLLSNPKVWKLDIWETINNVVRPWVQVQEERLMEY